MLWNSLRKLDHVKWWTIKKEIELSSISSHINFFFSVVQSLSHVQFCLTTWTAAWQAFLSFAFSLSLLKLMFIESMMPSNHLIVCHPLFLLSSIFFNLRVFSSESSVHIRWPMYESFNIRFPLGLTGLICLLSKGLSRGFSSATSHYAHSQFTIYFGYSFTNYLWCFFF